MLDRYIYIYIYIYIWSLDGISWYLHVNHSSILRDPLLVPPCLDTVLMIYGHLDLPKISAPPSDSAVIAEILRSRKSHPKEQQNMPDRHGDVSSLQNNCHYIETTVALQTHKPYILSAVDFLHQETWRYVAAIRLPSRHPPVTRKTKD